jgi:hypothetical protein
MGAKSSDEATRGWARIVSPWLNSASGLFHHSTYPVHHYRFDISSFHCLAIIIAIIVVMINYKTLDPLLTEYPPSS